MHARIFVYKFNLQRRSKGSTMLKSKSIKYERAHVSIRE